MGKLQFKNVDIKLEIEDHVFYIDIFDDQVNEGFKDMIEVSTKIQSTSDFESYAQVAQTLTPIFDKILGEGAMEQIFKGEQPRMSYIIQLARYLSDEINNQREENFRDLYVKHD